MRQNEHGYCPSCRLNFDGGSIWQHFFDAYGDEARADEAASHYGATRTKGQWGRQIHIKVLDGADHYHCPECHADFKTPAQGIEAGTGETRSGSIRQDESLVAESDAPDHPTATDWQNRAYRAEAECKELRAKLDHALDDINELGARLAIELAASQHGAG